MRDRFSRMDEVIRFFSDVMKENELTDEDLHNAVYYKLTREGVNERDFERDFSSDDTFEKISNDFKNKKSKVIIDPSSKYFCTIKNREEEFKDSEAEIKIYVPVNGDNMYRAVTAIFNFLGENDIPHVSNVSKIVRNDGIIVRLKNPEDVTDFLEFLKDEKRVRGIIDPNPFVYSLNGIAMTCDGRLSYNSVMVDLLCAYLRKSNVERSLSRTSTNDFIEFVKGYYIEHFVEKSNLDEVIGDITFVEDSDNSLDTNRKLVNVKDIMEMFLKGLDKTFGFPTLVEEYQSRCDKSRIDKEALAFKEARNKEASMSLSSVDKFLFRAIDIIMNKEMQNDTEAIEQGHSIKQYGDYERRACERIMCYLSTGNVEYLTRAEGLRSDAIEFDFGNKLKKAVEASGMPFQTYYNSIKENKQRNDLRIAVINTYDKYQKKYESGFSEYDGLEFVTYAINRLLTGNSYDGFTRDGNARYELCKYTRPKDAKRIIESELGKPIEVLDDITAYVKKIVNKEEYHI